VLPSLVLYQVQYYHKIGFFHFHAVALDGEGRFRTVTEQPKLLYQLQSFPIHFECAHNANCDRKMRKAHQTLKILAYWYDRLEIFIFG